MSIFMHFVSQGIQGLVLPFENGQLLDYEYVDDTALYLKGNMPNLLRMQEVL
jgi:hypothetical protein